MKPTKPTNHCIQFAQQEMYVVAPYPLNSDLNGIFKMQIVSDRGRTKWINIDNDQFKAIEAILLGCEYTLVDSVKS